jgi:hypothetical protein
LYKAQGLISPDLPELSFPELRNRLFRLEENINKSYGEADFTPLTNINTYVSFLTSLRNDVVSTDGNSWFNQYIDQEKVFVLNKENTGGEPNVFTYIFKPNILNDRQLSVNAYNQLKKIVDQYKETLSKNPTLGNDPGTFTVDGKTTKSKINSLNSLVIAPSAASLNVADSVRQSLNVDDIDWTQTFLIREKREPVGNEVLELIKKEYEFFRPITVGDDKITLLPTYNFVFDGIFRGKSSFNKIIDTTFSDVSKVKEQVVVELGLFLEKKIEGDSGLGFKPTIRNIMAMIFASAEAFIRLLDNVHTEAWKQRLNPIRQRVVVDGAKSSTTTESKDYVQSNNNNNLATEPIFPWPLYFVETNSPDGQPFEIRYCPIVYRTSASSSITRTGFLAFFFSTSEFTLEIEIFLFSFWYFIGIVKEKTEPSPSILATQILPPIRSNIFLEIAKPNPVPLYFFEGVPSICLNSSKIIFLFSSEIPIPVSLTEKRSILS